MVPLPFMMLTVQVSWADQRTHRKLLGKGTGETPSTGLSCHRRQAPSPLPPPRALQKKATLRSLSSLMQKRPSQHPSHWLVAIKREED